jgi:hypothetical protein
VFGDSTHPLFISKPKTFGKTLLAARKLYAGHGYVIRSAQKTLITELLFIDWLETIFYHIFRNFDPKKKAFQRGIHFCPRNDEKNHENEAQEILKGEQESESIGRIHRMGREASREIGLEPHEDMETNQVKINSRQEKELRGGNAFARLC